MKIKILIIVMLILASCTPEPEPKCELIIQVGYTAKDVCVVILETKGMVTVPCGKYKIGDIYCQ